MFFLVILALAGISSCEEQYNYHTVQDNATVTTLPDNEFIKLDEDENGYPIGIEYLDDIDQDTGLMVRALFFDAEGPLNAENDTRMNICDVLDKAIDDPNSPQAQYNMAESLGLATTRCPILKGIKVLSPYEFPTELSSYNLGCGPRYFQMRVENASQDLDTPAIMELRVNFTLTKVNETCPETSSSNLLMPSIISSLSIGLIAFQLNY